jgi:serine/threonine protein kinase
MRGSVVMSSDNEILAGRYRLVRRLGSGSSCDVYAAIDLELGVTVALKRFRETSPEALLRIKSEFRALSGIHAPGLVQFFHLVVSDDLAFFTMELVDGVALTEFARGVGYDDLRGVLARIVEAIGELHARGQLHRDLKPANILVTASHIVRVLDFGLAAAAGPIAGTPAYMAPELFDGQPASTASDWYSFGAVLYELLAGQTPASGRKLGEIIVHKQRRRFPAVRELAPTAPGELGELAWQLLDPDPARRPRRQDIAAVLAHRARSDR